MTLVFASVFQNMPFFMGDTLISSENSPSVPLKTPFLSPTDNISSVHGYYPNSFKQKIHIVNSKLIFGWAGSYINSKLAIREMDAFFKEKTPDSNEIYEFLEKLRPDFYKPTENDFDIIGFSVVDEIVYRIKWSFSQGRPTGNFKTCIGTGTQSAIEIFDQLNQRHWQADEQVKGVFSVLAELYCREAVFAENYFQSFGGFFEFAVFDESRFTKRTDYTVIMYQVEKMDISMVSVTPPLCALKSFYNGETLGVAKQTYLYDRKNLETDVWFIESILDTKVPQGDVFLPEQFSFNSPIQIHLFDCSSIKKGLAVQAISHGMQPIIFDPNGFKIANSFGEMLAHMKSFNVDEFLSSIDKDKKSSLYINF